MGETAEKLRRASKALLEAQAESPEVNSSNTGNFDKVVSTGSTLLDLAISGGVTKEGGIPMGVLIEIFGPSGTGKCVVGGTHVFMGQQLAPIQKHSTGIDGFTPFTQNIQTLAGASCTSHFFEETVEKTIVVTTALGLSLQGTQTHPILCSKNGTNVFVNLEDVMVGDYAVIPRNVHCFPTEDKELVGIPSVCREQLTLPKYMTEDIATLLGYLIANGSNKTTTTLRFSSTNEVLIADIKRIIKELGAKCPTYQKDDHVVGGIALKKFILFLCGEQKFPTARHKQIPSVILQSPKNIQIAFLRGLFDCDSHHSEKRENLEYCTASSLLGEQVQLLLLNLGIISRRRFRVVDGHPYTYLHITGDAVSFYAKHIGSLYYTFNAKKHNTNLDIIPGLRQYLASSVNEIHKNLQWKKNGCCMLNGKTFRSSIGYIVAKPEEITYPALQQFIVALQKMPSTVLGDKLLATCMKIYDAHYFFSCITAVDVVNTSQRVYDVTVPEGHNFISNGFVSHNSALLSEMAGNVQEQKGSLSVLDPEGRLDHEHAKIYGLHLSEGTYYMPDTVTEVFEHINEWEPENEVGPNMIMTDSLAALSTSMEMKEEDAMGMRRAKEFSQGLRKICRKIKNKNWLIACSNQIRVNMKTGGFSTPGGMGIPFYCSVRIQLSTPFKNKYLKKVVTVNGAKQEKIYGIRTECKIVKSSVDEPFRTAAFYLIFDYGIDDLRANLEYLKENSSDSAYIFPDFTCKTINKAIEYAEENDLEEYVRQRVISLWHEIQNKLRTPRKSKRKG